jgi:small subunit ribosomal protein S21
LIVERPGRFPLLSFWQSYRKSASISIFYTERGDFRVVSVNVRDNNVDQALRALKKKMQREGMFREMKLRRDFEKPSEKRKRERSESVRRWRKLERKRRERDGF